MHSVIRQDDHQRANTREPVSSGFTMLELLVTAGIVSLLLSLTVPAVQKTREAARQTQCKNNLKQLATAVHAFEAAHTRLPPSDLGDGWATWATLILPYLEQAQVYNEWDLTRSYYSQSALCGLDAPVYHCPSRNVSTRLKGDLKPFPRDGLYTGPLGWSDYSGMAGTGIDDADGAFVRAIDRNTGVAVAIPLTSRDIQFKTPIFAIGCNDFTDGQSSTMLFGEKHLTSNDSDPSVYNGDIYRGYLRACGPTLRIVIDPNYPALDGRNRYGSAHPGICHFAFVDGSVRGINSAMDGTVFGHLATRAGGEVISNVY